MKLNVILATLGSSGDVNPFIAMGKGMVARGHRATLVTNPHFEDAARSAGLGFEPVNTVEDYAKVTLDPNLWRPIRGLRVLSREVILRCMEPVFEAIKRLHRPGETVVAASGLAFGARIANEALGIPLVTVFLQPYCVRSLIDPPTMPFSGTARLFGRLGARCLYGIGDFLVDSVVRKGTNRYRSSMGLPPVRGMLNTWWMSPQRVLGVWPEWYASAQSDWPRALCLGDFVFHDTESSRAQAALAEAFFSSGEPPIIFTPGTAMRQGRDFLAAGAEACAILGRRGALVTPFAEHVPAPLPEGVVHLPYVPFGEYLSRACAIVHHGGIGTVAQALFAGIVQVVRPMAFDQFDNGARLERLGVGAAISCGKFRPGSVAAVLNELLSSARVQARAKELAGRMDRARGIRLACEALEETAQGGQVFAS